MNKYLFKSCSVLFACIIISLPIVIGDNNFNHKLFSNSFSNTLYVGGSGEGNYTSIQDAINDAYTGDTVYVYDESSPYYENIFIFRSISLIGENRDTTIVDAQHQGNVVIVNSDDVHVSGFTLKNCEKGIDDWLYSVVKVVGRENAIIENNILTMGNLNNLNYMTCIYLKDSSYNIIHNNIIYSNEIKGRTAGISFQDGANYNNISGNDISGFALGILLRSYGDMNKAEYNTFYENDIHHNSVGIRNDDGNNNFLNNLIRDNEHVGIDHDYEGYNKIIGNTITNNGAGGWGHCGLGVFHNHNTIRNNIISNNNPTGIWILGQNYIDITDNIISNNVGVGVYIDNSHHNNIVRNNFVDNGINAYFEYRLFRIHNNNWNENYWSDYNGNFRFPMIIKGTYYLGLFFSFPGFVFGWNPASEPYDI